MSTDRRGTAAGEVHQDPAELRRLRREVALRLHPDRGGDVSAFVAAMRSLEAGARPAPGPPEPGAGHPGPVSMRSSALTRTVRTTRTRGRRAVRSLRGRLPRSVPGSRRYGQL